MRTLTATEARNNIGELWEGLADGPVTILSAGHPVAGVIAHDDFAALLAMPLDRDFEDYVGVTERVISADRVTRW